MKTKHITRCNICPYFAQSKESADCIHSDAPKGAYEAMVPNSRYSPEPIPKWCPIRPRQLKIVRNSYDEVVSKTLLIVT